jgi:hydrogenase-4 component F
VAVSLFLLMVVAIFAGLIHHVGAMAFGTPPESVDRSPEAVSPLTGMLLLAAVMLLLGVFVPASLNGLLERAMEITLG